MITIEIQCKERIIKDVKIFYYLFYFILFMGIMIILSISRPIKIWKKESKIRMGCAYSRNAKYSIKVYRIREKREWIKMGNVKKMEKNEVRM